jgi:3-hydroxybutyryl-CoA dehydrogenase
LATNLDEVGDAEIVVETVVESLDVKREVFAALDRVCAEDAVLTSNTSAIPITTIAAGLRRPEFVVGTHFFSPVPLMRLCEIVRGFRTSDETVDRAERFAESLGKVCTVVNRDVAGFIASRLMTAHFNEAVRLLESGVASAEDIDRVCELGFGHAMGPFRTADLAGVDVIMNATRNIYHDTGDAKFAPPHLLQRMVDAGCLGRKTGQGFHAYKN